MPPSQSGAGLRLRGRRLRALRVLNVSAQERERRRRCRADPVQPRGAGSAAGRGARSKGEVRGSPRRSGGGGSRAGGSGERTVPAIAALPAAAGRRPDAGDRRDPAFRSALAQPRPAPRTLRMNRGKKTLGVCAGRDPSAGRGRLRAEPLHRLGERRPPQSEGRAPQRGGAGTAAQPRGRGSARRRRRSPPGRRRHDGRPGPGRGDFPLPGALPAARRRLPAPPVGRPGGGQR